jgi:hypothetical protein
MNKRDIHIDNGVDGFIEGKLETELRALRIA